MPSLGGTSTKITEGVDSACNVLTGRSALRVSLRSPQQGETSIIVVNADGADEQTLATRKQPDFFVYDGMIRLGWSLDGKTIACPAGTADAAGLYFNVVGVNVDDGTTKVLTNKRWGRVSQVAWLANNNDLVMVAQEEEAAYPQLWRLSSQSGELHDE